MKGMNWISVKERLPENAQAVLIAEYYPDYSSTAISGEYFEEYGGFRWVESGGMRVGRDVRYWMPLPEIPSE